MIPSAKLAALVLERNAETEAVQEKLVALVTRHHEELAALLAVMPALKQETLANVKTSVEAIVADAIKRANDTVTEQAGAAKAGLDALSQSALAAVGQIETRLTEFSEAKAKEIMAQASAAQATRDEIIATRKELAAQYADTLKATADSLPKLAQDAALAAALVAVKSDEAKETMRATVAEYSAPLIAALEASGTTFIDLFQGEFTAGKSAKRGEIWTYFGNTLLCLKDTSQAPSFYDLGESWALLAAKGAGGASGGGGGSSLPDQTGNSGKFLTTDGTDPSWATLAGGGDMLGANNLSDVANAVTAFTNIKQAATESATGVVELATSAETDAGKAVQASDTRLTNARTPTAHAATHVNGTDDIQDATAAQKGLATAAQIAKLDGIEAGADVTDATNVAAAGALMESALGTGVETALGIAVGSAGAPVTFNGALGTPSSGTLTNCTFPTLNQNTSGTAAGLSATLAVASGGTGATSVLTAQQAFNPLTINANTTTAYTLVLADAGKWVTMSNASASVLSVPNNNAVAFVIGTSVLCAQLGAGQVTISAADNTVTVSSRGNALKGAGQYAVWSLLKQDTNAWIATGDLTT